MAAGAKPGVVSDSPYRHVAWMTGPIDSFETRIPAGVGRFRRSRSRGAADRAGVLAPLAEAAPAETAHCELGRDPQHG